MVLPLAGLAIVAGISPALPREWLASLSAPKAAPVVAPFRTPTPLPERTPDLASAPSARIAGTPEPLPAGGSCDPAYPTVCLPPAPPRLTCAATGERSFPALPPDPHGLDSDRDGLACEPVAGG